MVSELSPGDVLKHVKFVITMIVLHVSSRRVIVIDERGTIIFWFDQLYHDVETYWTVL